MPNEARNHKDNLFCLLYRKKEHLLSLYNAVNGTSYQNESELEVVTLDGAIGMRMKNDAAFLIGSDLNLYEQQSTVNPNMPLRNLYYVSEELRRIMPPGRLYRKSQVKIPFPRFIVFYNGREKLPERQVYRLSDLFEKPEGVSSAVPELELIVTVLNINQGYSGELLGKCESLRGYTAFVEKVRRKRACNIPVEKAVSQSVEECIAEGILSDFFQSHKEEIVVNSIFEFDEELYKQAMIEDGMEMGIEKGIEKGIEMFILDNLEEGRADSIIIEKLERRFSLSREEAKERLKNCRASA